MADLIRIVDVAEYEGKDVCIQGWLYNKRSSGKLHFLQVRDGSATIQCVVFKGEVEEDTFDSAGNVTQESSVRVTGTVREDKRSPLGYEDMMVNFASFLFKNELDLDLVIIKNRSGQRFELYGANIPRKLDAIV